MFDEIYETIESLILSIEELVDQTSQKANISQDIDCIEITKDLENHIENLESLKSTIDDARGEIEPDNYDEDEDFDY